MNSVLSSVINLSLRVRRGATARALNKLMDEVQGTREEKVIQTIALRYDDESEVHNA